MSNHRSLAPLQMQNKEYEKILAKQRAKEDRNKQAQIRLPEFGAKGSQPLFDAPVKQSGGDEDQKRHLEMIIGPYDAVSSSLGSGHLKYLGIERQPATPLPSRQRDETFFPKPGNVRRKPEVDKNTHPTGDITQGGHGARKKLDPSLSDRSNISKMGSSAGSKSGSSSDVKPKHPNIGTSSSVHIHQGSANLGSGVSGSSSSGVGAGKSNGPISNTSNSTSAFHQSDHRNDLGTTSAGSSSSSSGINRKKQSTYPGSESSNQSMKQPLSREPVLSSIHKELLSTNPSSIHNKNKTVTSGVKTSEMTESKSHSDPLSVIKDNRNGAVFNGGSKYNRPRILIPAIDDMLEEFHIPQAVTEIQTPFKEMKFPFQEGKRESGGVDKSGKGVTSRKVLPTSNVIPSKVENSNRPVMEDIPGKDSSSDSDSDEDGDEEEDEEEEKEDNDSDSDSDLEKTKEANNVNTSGVKSATIKSQEAAPATVKVEPSVMVASSGSTLASHQSAPVKEQRHQPSMSADNSSSGSESSDSASDSESEDNEKEASEEDDSMKKQTTPAKKSSPDYPDTTPSPPRKWALREFLQNKESSYISKPASCEAPSSIKSDPDHFDEVTDVKRSADHISDENPPSVDPDSISKPMSADEFSPPAPVEKVSMLSPIKSPQPLKSPVKKPSKRSLTMNVSKASDQSAMYNKDTYDKVKNRERKSSISKSTVSDGSTSKSRRSRSKKSVKSVEIINDSTSSDSDNDADSAVVSVVSEKVLPKKSLPIISAKTPSSVCSTDSPSSLPRKKESRRSKNLSKDKELVRLKTPDLPTQNSKSDCDKKTSTKSAPQESGSIEEILKSFNEKTPLSPVQDMCQYQSSLKQAGLEVSAVKPVVYNGAVEAVIERPSVLVKIDLSLLQNFMAINKNSANVIKPLISANKSMTPQQSNISQSKLCPNDANSAKSSSRSLEPVQVGGVGSAARATPLTSSRVVAAGGDSSTQRQSNGLPDTSVKGTIAIKNGVESEESMSDSSDSEEEEVKDAIKTAVNSSSLMYSPSSHTQSHKNKRKIDSNGAADTKRRKTSPANVVQNHVLDVKKESESEKVPAAGKTGRRRDRHPSTSSQQSTQSNHSAVSTHSRASTSSSKHKRARREDHTSTTIPGPELKPLSTSTSAQSSHGRSPSQHSQSSKPSSSSSTSAAVRAAAAASASRQQTPRSDTAKHNGFLPVSRIPDKEEERLKTADEYHHQAKKYKHQADAMEPCVEQYMLYVEAQLAFILSGCVMETNKKVPEATNMYKGTQKLITHQYQQFKSHCDHESSDWAESKLSVLCLRIQSLINFQLYVLKKTEHLKLKRIIDDYFSGKSVKPPTSQPKQVSAPSPHQTSWNRSTGTPSPMSPTPSPANSVCSVGSVGSETPSKITNGSVAPGPAVPAGSVVVTQRIHSVIQRFVNINNYLSHAHELWDQADASVKPDIKDFFAHLDAEVGPLTIHSGLLHLVKYARLVISTIKDR